MVSVVIILPLIDGVIIMANEYSWRQNSKFNEEGIMKLHDLLKKCVDLDRDYVEK